MPVTITGGKYALATVSAATETTVTVSAATFVSGDFGKNARIIGVWTSAGVFRGMAYIRRFVSTTQLELEAAVFDPVTGETVTVVAGDTQVTQEIQPVETVQVETQPQLSAKEILELESIQLENDLKRAKIEAMFNDQAKQINDTVSEASKSLLAATQAIERLENSKQAEDNPNINLISEAINKIGEAINTFSNVSAQNTQNAIAMISKPKKLIRENAKTTRVELDQ